MTCRKVSARRRVLKALGVLVLNLVLWVVIPYYVGTLLAKAVPSTPLSTPSFVYEFGILITALQVIAALTEGMAVAVPFISGTFLVEAYYVWLATDGGNLAFSTSGLTVALGFQLLLIVLIAPSIWGAVRTPISYMIYRRAARSQVSPQTGS